MDLGIFGYVFDVLVCAFNSILAVGSRPRPLPKSTIFLLYEVLSVSGDGGKHVFHKQGMVVLCARAWRWIFNSFWLDF